MTTPFDEVNSKVRLFIAGLHTMNELIKSVEEHNHALNMIEHCSRHKDLAPGIKDFKNDIADIETFWHTIANIYTEVGEV
jgi:hypothetical protein